MIDDNAKVDRRGFLAAAGGVMLLKPGQVRGSAANSAVRLGLLGCGGRGTGVAAGFEKNAGARITALGDLFPDRLEAARRQFPSVAAGQFYRGPRAYQEIFASDAIDAVYIATPVWFHPGHFEAAVAAGKHVYVEKPAGVDVPGVKRMLAAARKAEGKQSVTMGLQLRHATPYVELVQRVRAGALGDIVCGLVHYYAGHLDRPPNPGATPAEQRLRDWVWDRVLSGDIIVEQNVHVIDFTNWTLQGHPLSATGTRGRKGRTDRGDCSSHYDCTFTYPNDVHVSFAATQFIKGAWDVAMRSFGTRGNSEAHYDSPVRITGEDPWEFPGLGPSGQVQTGQAASAGVFSGALDDADANKQKAFIASITSGRYLNEIGFGAESTLSAIMGRMAAETGGTVRWEDVLRSEKVLDPKMDIAHL